MLSNFSRRFKYIAVIIDYTHGRCNYVTSSDSLLEVRDDVFDTLAFWHDVDERLYVRVYFGCWSDLSDRYIACGHLQMNLG